jgi:hypothetical protein
MHGASTKHGLAHPRDVDDVDERMPHDLGERCTSAPHAQHEGAQLEHAQHGHAQQAWEHAHVDDKLHTSTPCTQYGHAGVRSAGTQSAQRGYAGGAQGAHAHGACLPCRVPPVCTLGAAAMPPTGAARRRARKQKSAYRQIVT